MAKTKFRPLHDRVVVKRIDAEEKSKGGIIIPAPPRRSRRKAKWSPWAPAAVTRAAS
jgi:co-chaperonin GroES (HSP10)